MRRLALFACFLPGMLSAAEPVRRVDNFSLRDPADKAVSLVDYKDRKAVVVVFIGTECTVSNAFMPRLAELSREYADRGVQFLAINSNAQDTPARVAGHAREHGLTFPVLKDPANVVADRFGAERTPSVFVLDPIGIIVYRGRIDDQYGVGFKRSTPTRRDLACALDEILAGKPVSVPVTTPSGCYIARVKPPRADGKITFTRDVAPILQQNCQECHRIGQVAPMPLLTYEDAVNWSETIREAVSDNRMPPWGADPSHGKFVNDRRLAKEDRERLLAWVEQGCARGDLKDMPPARTFTDSWTIGKPDVVFTMPKEYTVPAQGGKNGIRYQNFRVDPNFTEDMWIQAAEAKPGNRAVVHHIIVYVVSPDASNRPGQGPDGIGNGFLVAYAPGDLGTVFAAGAAKKIPKGSLLYFQMHYTPNGVEQGDRSSVGLIFAKQPPATEARTRAIAQQYFLIPAGAANHEVESRSIFKEDVELLSLLPHMHLRGKDFTYRVIYPDGKEEVLLSVPRYDFNWQSVYRFEKPLRLPAGSKVVCTAHFDNSARNFNNPDPSKIVKWGEQTWEEMMIGFVDYRTVPTEKKP
jgi:peroxiredoxin